MGLKFFLLLAICLPMVFAEEVKPETRAMSFIYKAGAVAAYPPGTGLIYKAGTAVDLIAGATVNYVFTTTVTFPEETVVYRQAGPQTVAAGESVTFNGGVQVAYAPGTKVIFPNGGEVRYMEFNGNTHAIAAYPAETSVQYYYGPKGSNLILFAPGSNILTIYNPGGSTQFGWSPLPVEKEPETPVARTYGQMGGGYSYCSGYSYCGWPQTTYYNSYSGYRGSCYQTGYNSYSYSNNGGGSYYGGGGGGGGSYYGGGYYGK